jgi:hypothetical protein
LIPQDHRIREWLDQGWELLNRGLASEGADVFARVLLVDPASQEARRGADQAQALCQEVVRLGAERLREAEAACAAGDDTTARRLAEEVIAQGGDRDRAHALLDRLDRWPGRSEPAPAKAPAEIDLRLAPPRSAARAWSRQAFLAGCATLFALLLGGAASSFEGLLERLERPPVPGSFTLPPSTALPASSPGEQTVAHARRLLDQGDAAGAVTLLREVKPAEPAYPFAQQLMGQASAELERRRGGR